MNTGQMIMIQMPIETAQTVAATPSSQLNLLQGEVQDSSPFAGILNGIALQASTQPTVAAGEVSSEIKTQEEGAVNAAVPLIAMEMNPVILAKLDTLPTLHPSIEAKSKPAESEPTEHADEQKPSKDLILQETLMSAIGSLISSMPQTNSTMSESEQNAALAADSGDAASAGIQKTTLKADGTKRVDTVVTTPATIGTKPGLDVAQSHKEAVELPVIPALPQIVSPVERQNIQQINASSTAQTAESLVTVGTVIQKPSLQAATEITAGTTRGESVSTNTKPVITAPVRQIATVAGLSQETIPLHPMETVTLQTSPQAPTIATAPPVKKPILEQIAADSTALPDEPFKTSLVSTPAIQRQTELAGTTPEMVMNVHFEADSTNAKPDIAAPVRQSPPVTASTKVESAIVSVADQAVQKTTTVETPAARNAPSTLSKSPMQQIMEAYSRPYMAATETPAAATADLNPVEAAVQTASVEFAKPEQGVQKPTPISGQPLSTISEQTQTVAPAGPVQHAIETGLTPVRVAVKTNDNRAVAQEEPHQAAPATTEAKAAGKAENVLVAAAKTVASSTPGDDSRSGDKSMQERAMNGQIHMAIPQQIKTETAAASTSTAGSTSGVAEQVAKQVSDHIAKHEIKTGNDQIVIRLSPENLGELKVNLRMENQRLTVEIVTENRMVRDSLLQNSDTLKESLAKQNIKMDSFDVSTGSNSQGNLAGRSDRNQNEWQEQVKNRQTQQWLQGGYNVPKDLNMEKLAYIPQRQHLMLDVHF